MEIKITTGETPNFPAALRAVESSLTPLPDSRIREALAELEAITARRRSKNDEEEEMSIGLVLRAYTQRLREYPADVVLHVIATWDSKWWPEWADLKAKLEEHVIPRRALAHRLARAQPEYEARKEAEARTPPTDEQRAAVQAEVDAFLSRATAGSNRTEDKKMARTDAH